MTEEEIKALIASEVERQLAVSNVEQPDYEVLETVMFDHPSDWGRRIILRNNEIVLQHTGNKGITWKDEDLGDLKIMLPTTTAKTKTVATSTNTPYKGLYFTEKSMTKAANLSEAEELKICPEMQEIIDSGQLLRKSIAVRKDNAMIKTMSNLDTTDETPQSSTLERITFLGGFSIYGLEACTVYLDENRFMKLA